jgi:hypothetical protein
MRIVAPSLLAAMIGLSGCGEPTAVVLTLRARVQSYVNLHGINGTNVQVYAGDEVLVAETTTNSLGDFEATVAVPYTDDGVALHGALSEAGHVGTDFYREIQFADLEEARLAVTPGHVRTSPEIFLAGISLAPVSDATGSVSGRIFDAVSKDQAVGIGGLELTLREGVNPPLESPVIATTVTGGDGAGTGAAFGSYSFNGIPAGTYTVFIDGGQGWLDAYFSVVCVGGADSPKQQGATSEELGANEFRVVLSWGLLPEDLDAHLSGPASPGESDTGAVDTFHVYYAAPSSTSSFLDVDDVTSEGPETVTVSRMEPGLYRYSLHDYTNREASFSDAMSASGARVQLFVGNGRFESFDIPLGQPGTVWTVFELDGETGTPYLVNRFSYQADPSVLSSF